ncbi:MAG TPA: O-methyltransferase [Bacteroidales bacterium]|nr:O-methyltransferase [Bacteroidales bacterium]
MLKDPQKIEEYILKYSSPEDEVLNRLNRETHLTTVYPRMLSGHLQGKFLEMISFMIRPHRILEIGTFTGYSAICLAKGLAEGGLVHTIDINDELAETALRYFKEAKQDHLIKMHIGDAVDVVPNLNEVFDLVFIDGDKEQYIDYYEVVLPKLRTGGFILVDNVLWSGKVLPDCRDNDKETICIREFNNFIQNDKRIEKLLLPFRDGIYIFRKLI